MKKGLSIQITILISFLSVLIIASGATIFYNYVKTNKAFMDDVEADIEAATTTIQDQTYNYLMSARISTQFIAWVSGKNNTVIDNSEDIALQSMKMLDLFPQISGFYNGDKRGNLLAIKRVAKDSMYPFGENKKLPANAKYEIRVINRSSGVVTEFYTYKDTLGRTVAISERPRADEYFDPRRRPWFQGAEEAKQPFWSDPYIFLLSRQVGITAATPILDDNNNIYIVISADITMKDISINLTKSRIGKSGITFILRNNGEVVGYPGIENIERSNESDLPTYKDTKNAVLIKAYEHYRKTNNLSFDTKVDDIDYLVRLKPFGEELGKEWLIGFIAPKSDFTGQIDNMTRLSLIFSGAILVIATIMIFFISRNIARPVERAARAMSDIGRFKISNTPPAKSWFFEIQLMNEALQAMEQSLKDFSRFVPKAVVSKLIESGSGAKIGGRKRNVTLLFTDIAGFTSISEKMTSEKLIEHLSDYLNRLTIIIQKHDGTIDKYIGDAIMTFWGAPIDDPEHPIKACKAALMCKRQLDELNKNWELDGKPAFYTRFGLHTGDAIIGNVGSEDRLNYSAFGDTVNLAARIEGINKYYGTTIMISHETYKNVRHKFICRPVDIVAVKGKVEGIKIYELLFEISEDPNQKLDMEEAQIFSDMTEAAFIPYLKKDWNKALKKYEELLKEYPKDNVAEMFIARCKEYKQNAPPEDWNGIYVMTSK